MDEFCNGITLSMTLHCDKNPLLIGSAVAGPLDDRGVVGGGVALYVYVLTIIAADDAKVAAADGAERPLRVAVAVVVVLNQLRALGGGGTRDIDEFPTIAVDDLDVTAAGILQGPLLIGLAVAGVL